LNRKDNPYGLSPDDTRKGAKRAFAGGTLSKSFYNQTIYAFGLAQIDSGGEPNGIKTHYDSQYYGGGLKGVPFEGLDYVLEGTYEMGNSYTSKDGSDANSKKKISALMAYAEIAYYFDATMKPSIKVQYAFGSGDADRTYGNTSSQMVNGSSGDKAFVPFGTFDGGLALRPSLSNIRIIRAGAGFIPFDSFSSDRLKKLSVNFMYSYYMKDKAAAPINVNEADKNNADVGQGLDLSLRWKAYYELSFFAQYGLFVPGKAYSSSETRNSVLAGSMLEF
jgi:hypothetical protein